MMDMPQEHGRVPSDGGCARQRQGGESEGSLWEMSMLRNEIMDGLNFQSDWCTNQNHMKYVFGKEGPTVDSTGRHCGWNVLEERSNELRWRICISTVRLGFWAAIALGIFTVLVLAKYWPGYSQDIARAGPVESTSSTTRLPSSLWLLMACIVAQEAFRAVCKCKSKSKSVGLQGSHGQSFLMLTAIFMSILLGSELQAEAVTVITAIKAVNGPGTGGTTMTVTGGGFGTDDPGAGKSVRLGGSACASTVWQSESSLECLTAPGVQQSLWAVVTMSGSLGTLLTSFSYDSPVCESLPSRANIPALPSEEVKIFGVNFGVAGYTAGTRLGQTGCESTSWLSDSSLTCTSPSGLSATQRVTVTSAVQSGTLTEALSFDAVSLSGVNPGSLGNDVSVTVSGAGMGSYGQTAGGRVGGSACEATSWVSDSSVVCMFGYGVGGTWRVTVTAGGRGGSVTEAVSYDTMVSSVKVSNMATVGSVSLTVGGYDFGSAGMSVGGRVGASACEATDWVSDSSLVCKHGRGVQGTLHVVVTGGVVVGSMSEAVSYDSGRVSSLLQSNVRSAGSMSISISGSGFGSFGMSGQGGEGDGSAYGRADHTMAARIASSAAQYTSWVSDTSVICRVGTGVGATQRLVITTGARTGSLSEALTYDSATLSSFLRANTPSTGSVLLTVLGAAFGYQEISQGVRAGFSSCEGTNWISDSALLCLSSSGFAATHRTAVTAGRRVGSHTEAVSFDTPRVTSVLASNCPVLGSCNIFILGSGFGHTDTSTAVRIGRTACATTPWISSSSLSCKVPYGSGAFRSVVATVGMRSMSLSVAFSYDHPVILSDTLRKWPMGDGTPSLVLEATKGNETISFDGANFGPLPHYITVTFGHPKGWGTYICDINVTASSDTLIVCTVPAGIGSNHRFQVFVDNQNAVGTDFLSYPPPILATGAVKLVNSIQPPGDILLSTTEPGFDELEISGLHFGSIAYSIAVSYGPRPNGNKYICLVLNVTDHSKVTCRMMSGGSGIGHVLNVTVGRQSVISQDVLNYPAPYVRASFPSVGMTTVGGIGVVILQGENFGPQPGDVRIRFGNYFCAVPGHGRLFSRSRVSTCVIPSGNGIGHTIYLSVSEQKLADAVNLNFSYPAPSLFDGTLKLLGPQCTSPSRCGSVHLDETGIAVVTSRTTVGGIDVVELQGRNFGPISDQVKIEYGYCTAFSSSSRSSPASSLRTFSRHPCGDRTVFNPLHTCSLINAEESMVNHTRVRCILESGSGIGYFFRIIVAGQVVYSRDKLAYAEPMLYTVSFGLVASDGGKIRYNASVPHTFVGSTTIGGFDLLKIYGRNFGPIASALEVTYGPPSNPKMFSCVRQDVAPELNHTETMCSMSSGNNFGHVFRFALGDYSLVMPIGFAYPQPILKSGSLRYACDEDVDNNILSVKHSFEPSIGLLSMVNILYHNDTCMNRSTSVNATSFRGGDILEINGENFGPDPGAISVSYSRSFSKVFQTAVLANFTSHTTIRIRTSPGLGHSLIFAVSVGNQTAQGTDLYHYPEGRRVAVNQTSSRYSYVTSDNLRVATVGRPYTITIQALDYFQRKATGGGDSWTIVSLERGTLPITSTAVDNFDGTYGVSTIFTRSGSYIVHIRLMPNAEEIMGSPFVVKVGPSNIAKGEECSASINTQTAGLVFSFRLETRDSWGNEFYGAPDLYYIDVVTPVGATSAFTSQYIAPPAVQAPDQRWYVVGMHVTASANYSLRLYYNGSRSSKSPYTLEVIPGTPSLISSLLLPDTSSRNVTADDVTVFNVQLRDYYGNNRTLASDIIAAAISSGPVLRASAIHVEPGHGLHRIKLALTRSGTYNIEIGIPDLTHTFSFSPLIMRVYAGVPSPLATITQGAGLTSSIAGEKTALTVRFFDQYSNPVVEDGVPSTVQMLLVGQEANNASLVAAATSVNIAYNGGEYTIEYEQTRKGYYALSVLVSRVHIYGSPFVVSILAGHIQASNCRAIQTTLPDVVTAWKDGFFGGQKEGIFGGRPALPLKIIILAQDAYGNLASGVTGISVLFTIDTNPYYYVPPIENLGGGALVGQFTPQFIVAGRYDLIANVKYKGNHISGSPFTTVIWPAAGPPFPRNTFATGPALSGTQAGISSKMIIQTADSFGLQLTLGGLLFDIKLVLDDTTFGVTNWIDYGTGQYQITIMATVSGTYQLSVLMLGSGANAISGSPFSVLITPGKTSVHRSIAIGSGLSLATAGLLGSFKIQARDTYSNNQRYFSDPEGGDSFTVSLEGPVSAQALVTDMEDGTYRVAYITTTSGLYAVVVQHSYNSVTAHIRGGPFSLIALAADISATGSQLTGEQLDIAIAGNRKELFVTLRDEFGNSARASQQHLTVVIQEERVFIESQPLVIMVMGNATILNSTSYYTLNEHTANSTNSSIITANVTTRNARNLTQVVAVNVSCVEGCIEKCRNLESGSNTTNNTENKSDNMPPGCYVVCDNEDAFDPNILAVLMLIKNATGNETGNFSSNSSNFTYFPYNTVNISHVNETNKTTHFSGCPQRVSSADSVISGFMSISTSNVTGNVSENVSEYFVECQSKNSTSSSETNQKRCYLVCNETLANSTGNISGATRNLSISETCVAACNASCNTTANLSRATFLPTFGMVQVSVLAYDMINISYVLTRSGKYTISVSQGSFNISGSPLKLTVLCNEASAANSELVVSRKKWQVDGPLYSTIMARDGFGNPGIECSFPSNDVSMELAGDGWATAAVVTNNMDGSYTGVVAPLRLGYYAVFATLLGGKVLPPPNTTSDVVVIPGAMSASSSGPKSFSTTVVGAGNPAIVPILVRDVLGNPTYYREPSSELRLDIVPRFAHETNAKILDLNYTLEVSFNTTTAGNYMLHVILGGNELSGSPYAIVVLPLDVDPGAAIVSGEGLTLALAGVSSSFFIAMRDKFGNGVFSDPFRVDPPVIFDLNKTDGRHSVRGGITGADGVTFSASYRLTLSGIYALTVYIGGIPLISGGLLIVQPNQAYAQASSVMIFDRFMYAGGNLDIFVTLKDVFGNKILNHSSSFSTLSVRFSATKPSLSRPQAFAFRLLPAADEANATLVIKASSNISGNATASIFLWSSQQLPGSPRSITVLPLSDASAAASTVEGALLVGGAIGNSLEARVRVRDIYGNQVTYGDPGVTVNVGSSTVTGVREMVGEFVEYIARYVPTSANTQEVRVLLAGQHVSGSPFNVSFATEISGPVIPSQSFAFGPGLASAVAGSLSKFTIQAVNVLGYHFPTGGCLADYSVNIVPTSRNGPNSSGAVFSIDAKCGAAFTMTMSGWYMIHVTSAGTSLLGSPYALSVQPAAMSVAHTIVGGVGLTLATAGMKTYFRIQARDQFSNPLLAYSYFDSLLQPFSAQVGGIGADLTPPLDENVNGSMVASYTPTISGVFTTSVIISGVEALGSPFSLSVSPGVLSPSKSIAIGAGLSSVAAGSNAEFRLRAFDAQGTNKVLFPSDSRLRIWFPTSNTTSFAKILVDGSNLVVKYSITASSTYTLEVSFAEVHFLGSPFAVRVVPGVVDTSQCTAEGLGLQEATAGDLSTFVITSRDTYGNELSSGGYTFKAMIEEPSPPKRYFGVCRDFNTGYYNCTYTSITQGIVKVSLVRSLRHIASSPKIVPVVNAAFNASQSLVIDGAVLRYGVAGNISSVSIRSFDSFKNKISTGGKWFSVALSGPQSFTVFRENFQDYLNGTYTAYFTPTIAGNYTLSVMYQQQHIPPSPFKFVVLPHIASTKESVVDWPSLVSCGMSLCGSVSEDVTILLTPKDSYGNLRMGIHPLQALVMPNSSAIAYESSVPSIVSGTGETRVRFAATAAGRYLVSLTLGGDHLSGSPYIISMSAGLFSSGGMFVALGKGLTLVSAGQMASFRIESRDSFGNAIPEAISVDAFSLNVVTAAGDELLLNSTVLAADGGGLWFANMLVNSSGSHYLTVSAIGLKALGSPHLYTVVSRPVFNPNCEVYGEGRHGAIATLQGRKTGLFVQLRDDLRNPVSIGMGEVVVVTMRFLVGGRTLNLQPKAAKSGVLGLLEVQYVPTIYEIGTAICEVKINGEHLFKINPILPGFYVSIVDGVVGAISPSRTFAYGDGISSAIAGMSTPFAIQAVSSDGLYFSNGGGSFRAEFSYLEIYETVLSGDSGDGSYSILYTLTVSGSYVMYSTMDGVGIAGSPFKLTVYPAETSVEQSVIQGAGLTIATAGTLASFRVEARDSFSNAQLFPRGTPVVPEFHVDMVGPTSKSAVVTHMLDSLFQATYTVTESGLYMFSISVASRSLPVRTFDLRVNPSLAYGETSSLDRTAPTSVTAGKLARLPLNIRDIFGNKNSIAEDGVPWFIARAIALPGPITLPVVSSGDSFVALVNLTKVGHHLVHITVRGSSLVGSPCSVLVVHASLSPQMSSAGGAGLGGGRADSMIPLVITSRDAFGNAYIALKADDISLSLSPASSEMSFNVTSVSDGKAAVLYTVWKHCSPCLLTATLQGRALPDSPYNVVIEYAEAPQLVEVRLDYGLTSMVLKFNMDTDRGGISGSFPCSRVVDESSLSVVGADSTCTWVTSDRIRLVLGTFPVLSPLIPLMIRPGIIMSYRSNSLKASGSKPIQLPLNGETPSPLIFGPSLIGPCDSLVLDASASPGGGGRPLRFQWGVKVGAPGRDALMSLMLAMPLSASTLKIANTSLVSDSYEFFVTTTNFLGQTSQASHKVVKVAKDYPVVAVVGPPQGRVRRSNRLLLRAQVQQPADGCWSGQINSFSWQQTEGPQLNSWPEWELTRSSPTLVIPPMTLSAGERYAFTVTVGGKVSVSTVVTVDSSPLVVAVVGGNNRTVSPASTVVVDASLSYDPDSESAPIDYAWSCSLRVGGGDCFSDTSELLLVNTPSLKLPAGTLKAGTDYVITVTISKDPGPRTAFTRVDIVVTSAPSSSVAIQINGMVSNKFSPNLRLVLLGNLTSAQGVGSCPGGQYTWSLPLGDSDIGSPSKRSTPLMAPNFVLAPGALVAGQQFAVQLEASCPGETAGRARLKLIANSPPSGGIVAVSPSSGRALTTIFRIEASLWADDLEDLPLSYLFSSLEASAASSAIPTPLSGQVPDNALRVVVGANFAQGNVTNKTVFVVVCDNFGACSDRGTGVSITLSASPASSQANIEADFAAISFAAAARGDMDVILQACGGAGIAVAQMSAADSRRLLAAGSGASLRQSIMWAISNVTAKTVLDTDMVAFAAASLQLALAGWGAAPLNPLHDSARMLMKELTRAAAKSGFTAGASQSLSLAVSDASLAAGSTAAGRWREDYYSSIEDVLSDLGRASLVGRVPFEESQALDSPYVHLTVQRLGKEQMSSHTVVSGRCGSKVGTGCHDVQMSPNLMPLGGYAVDVHLVNWGTLRRNESSGNVLMANVTGIRLLDDLSQYIEGTRLFSPSLISFPLANITLVDDTIPRCTYWLVDRSQSSQGKGVWSGVGCIAIDANHEYITCACYHLSDFAVPATRTLGPMDPIFALQDMGRLIQDEIESLTPLVILAIIAGVAVVLAVVCSFIPKPPLAKLGPLIDLQRLKLLQEEEDSQREAEVMKARKAAWDRNQNTVRIGDKEVKYFGTREHHHHHHHHHSNHHHHHHDSNGDHAPQEDTEMIHQEESAQMDNVIPDTKPGRIWSRVKLAIFWELWLPAFSHMMKQRHVFIGVFFSATGDPLPPAARALILCVHAASVLSVNMLLLGAAGFTDDQWLGVGVISAFVLMPLCPLWAMLFRLFFTTKTSKGPLGGLVMPSRIKPVREEVVVEVEGEPEEEENEGERKSLSPWKSAGDISTTLVSDKPAPPPGRSSRPNTQMNSTKISPTAVAASISSLGTSSKGKTLIPVGGVSKIPKAPPRKSAEQARTPRPAPAALLSVSSQNNVNDSANKNTETRVSGGSFGISFARRRAETPVALANTPITLVDVPLSKKAPKPEPEPRMPWLLAMPLYASAVISLLLTALVATAYGRAFGRGTTSAWLGASFASLVIEYFVFQTLAICAQAFFHVRAVMLLAAGEFEWRNADALEWEVGASEERSISEPRTVAPTPMLEMLDEEQHTADVACLKDLKEHLVVERWLETVLWLHDANIKAREQGEAGLQLATLMELLRPWAPVRTSEVWANTAEDWAEAIWRLVPESSVTEEGAAFIPVLRLIAPSELEEQLARLFFALNVADSGDVEHGELRAALRGIMTDKNIRSIVPNQEPGSRISFDQLRANVVRMVESAQAAAAEKKVSEEAAAAAEAAALEAEEQSIADSGWGAKAKSHGSEPRSARSAMMSATDSFKAGAKLLGLQTTHTKSAGAQSSSGLSGLRTLGPRSVGPRSERSAKTAGATDSVLGARVAATAGDESEEEPEHEEFKDPLTPEERKVVTQLAAAAARVEGLQTRKTGGLARAMQAIDKEAEALGNFGVKKRGRKGATSTSRAGSHGSRSPRSPGSERGNSPIKPRAPSTRSVSPAKSPSKSQTGHGRGVARFLGDE